MNIRQTKIRRPSDLEVVLEETGLFPSEMLSDMIWTFCQKMQAKTFGSLTKMIVRALVLLLRCTRAAYRGDVEHAGYCCFAFKTG